MVRLIQLIISVVRLATPWIIRAIVVAVELILTTLVSIWVGIPNAVEQIALDWQGRAIDAGFPRIWDRRLYLVLWWAAFLTVILGWILLSFMTVFIVNLLF